MPIELDQAIDLAVTGMRRVAVVGASTDPFRASNSAMVTLLERGYEVVPVNPTVDEVLGQRAYPDLASVPGRVDVVDVFRREEHLPGVARDAVARDDVAVVWNQLGLFSPEARDVVLGAGRGYVEHACLEATVGRRGLRVSAAPRLEPEVVLLDLDDTVLDHDACERTATGRTLTAHGLPDDEDAIDTYVRVNAGLWAEYRAGRIEPAALRVGRWQRTLEELDVAGEARWDAAAVVALSEAYLEAFSSSAVLLPGAAEAVWWLRRRSAVAVATNGFAEVQAQRVAAAGLGEELAGVLASSEEAGVAKPDPAVLRLALGRVDRGDVDPARVVMVGDQLATDVAAGAALGATTVWIADEDAVVPEGADAPDHRVARLAELA